ncbi:glycogen synthase [Candidatus Gottesmanbacteria bacterium]|nr:glycogen synthase [Candidatus Gottesmanbacteria bacterium]
MKVLYCVSEVAPIIKVGGLGDVAGSLPKALARLGVDIRIIVPAYEEILTRINTNTNTKRHESFKVEFAGREEEVVLRETALPQSEVPVYFLENKTYLSRDGHQAFAGTEKEVERFAFFSKAIAEFVPHTPGVYYDGSSPRGCVCSGFDLLHLNDWHTSLVPLLLPAPSQLTTHNPPVLLTIHNLSYQGIGSLGLLDKLGLKSDSCRVLKWDAQNRDIDILMEGIIHATFVNTVSPTYAKEIMTPEFGCGIEEILKGKEGRVTGILNGIDCEVWNPGTDPLINFQFGSPLGVFNFQVGKQKNKRELQRLLGLKITDKTPLLAFIGRLEPKQKGLDILYEAMEKLLPEENFQFVLLGTGDPVWERQWGNETMKQWDNFRFICRFDEKLAHQIYAGADMILLPSKFEPCGLPQMIGMRYGTLPLVRKTGGLADTVKDNVNGFMFEEHSGEALADKIKEALEKCQMSNVKCQMIENAMSRDFSWEASAQKYLELYKRAMALHNR